VQYDDDSNTAAEGLMTAEETTDIKDAGEAIGTVMALADREEEIEHLRRMLVFSVGVSVGLAFALHLVLRRG
jgi:hypothetical protein